jgi:quercetin dioxygenase-like cupin family protein
MAYTASYKVKNVETVVKGTDVQVRVFTLAPGETIPWHFHRDSTDHYFVLEGLLSISTRGPASTIELSIGQSDKVTPGTTHLIANGGEEDCRFLLVQGVGAYDWNAAEK